MDHVIGVDCAAQDKKCGIALGRWSNDRVQVIEVATGLGSVVPTLSDWLRAAPRSLVAMDAPLGWPAPLGVALSSHRAGDPLAPTADELFHRATDRSVRDRTGKRPMEVGADKIARAARRAVEMIGELRTESGLALPLAWMPGPQAQASVIEVYPATTLRSRGLSDSGYKGTKPEHQARRKELVEGLRPHLDLSPSPEALVASDDALDAVVCLLAAADFLLGNVVVPSDLATAKREGWIWFSARL